MQQGPLILCRGTTGAIIICKEKKVSGRNLCKLAFNWARKLQNICHAIQKEYFWFHSPIQGELQPGESQSSTAQEDDRKGGKPSETMLTEGTATQEMMRKKGEVNEEEPKSKPHKQVPCPSHNHFRFMDFHDEVNQAITPTVGQIFKETVEKFPMHPALKYKEDETWKTITYTEYYNLCIKAAKSFLKVRVGAP